LIAANVQSFAEAVSMAERLGLLSQPGLVAAKSHTFANRQGIPLKATAASNKVSEDELEEVYRRRSMLKLSVLPEDIAEGVYFFASDHSA